MDLSKIKNKEVRLNALSFQRRETGLDDEFMELVKLADKINILGNNELSFHASVPEESRAVFSAAKSKFQFLQNEFNKLAETFESLGLDSKKVMKCLSDNISKRVEFQSAYLQLDSKLPLELKMSSICPYFRGFLPEQ